MDWVTEIGFFGYTESAKKWVEKQVEQGFFSFFAECVAYLMTFQRFSALQFEKTSNIQYQEKMKKSLVFNLPISPWHLLTKPKTKTQVLGTQSITNDGATQLGKKKLSRKSYISCSSGRRIIMQEQHFNKSWRPMHQTIK